jgi:hypothetical protein
LDALCLHLERARYRERELKNCLVCQQFAGGVPGQGVVVEGVKEVKYTPMAPGMYKNGKKGGFMHFLACKLQKRRFLLKSTYITIYTTETFFEEYINYKIFCYLRNCGVISVQSFGSQIGPQPPRLGLLICQ